MRLDFGTLYVVMMISFNEDFFFACLTTVHFNLQYRDKRTHMCLCVCYDFFLQEEEVGIIIFVMMMMVFGKNFHYYKEWDRMREKHVKRL